MEIVKNSFESATYLNMLNVRNRTNYQFWKHGKYKYHYWLACKHKEYQYVDVWDRYILSKVQPGLSVVYDCAAIYYTRLLDNVLIVENEEMPLTALDKYHKTAVQLNKELIGKVKNFISFRPRSLKQMDSLFDFFTKEQLTRSGMKPAIINWLADDALVFLSIGQEYIAFNRFKLTLDQIIDKESQRLDKIGLKLLTKIKSAGDDYANGRYKLVYQYKK